MSQNYATWNTGAKLKRNNFDGQSPTGPHPTPVPTGADHGSVWVVKATTSYGYDLEESAFLDIRPHFLRKKISISYDQGFMYFTRA
jgi:hypothetical protein